MINVAFLDARSLCLINLAKSTKTLEVCLGCNEQVMKLNYKLGIFWNLMFEDLLEMIIAGHMKRAVTKIY